MTEKRYKYKDIHYMSSGECLELVNGLSDENMEFRVANKNLQAEVIKLIKENGELSDALHDSHIALGKKTQLFEDKVLRLQKENEQLKVYKNLFNEFQKQLTGVKKLSDLDSKDLQDLIELTKGHVFDEEHGWIYLPIRNDSTNSRNDKRY